MRVLLLLRGAPGCGKTTWIAQNGLADYALSADDIRMLCSGPQLTVDGGFAISQSNDKVVWATLFRLLEQRMQNGEFTVIDATNSKTSEMNRYKELCEQYKYRIYCVDFTNTPIETVKQRNAGREPLKRVPDEVIDKMYARFETQKIPSGITVLQPDELDKVWMKKFDLSAYKRIHVIGDIHGCYTPLKEYFDADSGLHNEDFYIFLGDYIDRGIENVEVVNFLLTIYNKPNVLLLEGNHERWLWIWANGGVCDSKEFELATKTQLENAEIDKKDVRLMYRRFGQCAWFIYHGSDFLVTHGGLSRVPENLSLVSTMQMIKGVGTYNEFEAVENAFAENATANCYQIHGHRNTKRLPTRANDRNFNLEGAVEFGGELRAVQLLPNGEFQTVEIRNTVYKPAEERVDYVHRGEAKNIGDMVINLRQNKFVQEKRFGNLSSFNFTKQAFYDKVWDEQTTKARGLFINVPKQKIVARSYDKFFNVNERPETKLDMLQYVLRFPVRAYVKENGFLGIASYNDEDDSLFITTKSNPDGDYAVWLRGGMEMLIGAEKMEKIKQYAKEHNVSFVFEYVDMVHDPHVIEYLESSIFLLDIIFNDMNYHKLPFEEMCAVADEIGLRHKELAYELDTWQEFFDWYYEITSEDYLYHGRHIEGFVVEDTSGFMVKLKLHYYNFWKWMRGIAHEAIRKGYIDGKRTSSLVTPLANHFYAWAKTLHDREDVEALPKDICTLRNMFFDSENGKEFRDES